MEIKSTQCLHEVESSRSALAGPKSLVAAAVAECHTRTGNHWPCAPASKDKAAGIECHFAPQAVGAPVIVRPRVRHRRDLLKLATPEASDSRIPLGAVAGCGRGERYRCASWRASSCVLWIQEQYVEPAF